MHLLYLIVLLQVVEVLDGKLLDLWSRCLAGMGHAT